MTGGSSDQAPGGRKAAPAEREGGGKGAREARLAAALRTNLLRRKAAARAAQTGEDPGKEDETG